MVFLLVHQIVCIGVADEFTSGVNYMAQALKLTVSHGTKKVSSGDGAGPANGALGPGIRKIQNSGDMQQLVYVPAWGVVKGLAVELSRTLLPEGDVLKQFESLMIRRFPSTESELVFWYYYWTRYSVAVLVSRNSALQSALRDEDVNQNSIHSTLTEGKIEDTNLAETKPLQCKCVCAVFSKFRDAMRNQDLSTTEEHLEDPESEAFTEFCRLRGQNRNSI